MEASWTVLQAPPKSIDLLVGELGISPLIARLLVLRGISSPDEASAFLNPRLDSLHDPYLMKDMDCVVTRIVKAVQERERILIYGDYDVDGITAVVVLRRALEMLGCQAEFYLPKRLEEGYGLRAEVIQNSAEQGYGLIISVDSGVRAFDACGAARQAGIDLIVTDHHLPDTTLPCAYAILNPRRPDCGYPDKNLAAVGVVFKIVQALFRRFDKERVLEHFLKLVAIGTVADMVPITGENRVIVRHGLERLADPHNVGLKALLEGSGIGREVSLFDIGFKLAPRMNAVTRMGGGPEVVNLFTTRDPGQAGEIVRSMTQMNSLRQKEEASILEQIEDQIRREPERVSRQFLVFAGEGWHKGVIGIVASRLVERFYRPAIVLSSDGSVCQGSGRSIPGVHLLDAIDGCRDLLTQYGGHAQAAGCTLPSAHWEALADRLHAYVASHVPPSALCPSVQLDSLLRVSEISIDMVRDLEKLAPFGIGNPVPLFASEQVEVAAGPWVLKDKHLKLQVGSNGSRVDAIWWKNGQAAATLRAGARIDVAYSLTRERYQGRETVLLGVKDLRLAVTD